MRSNRTHLAPFALLVALLGALLVAPALLAQEGIQETPAPSTPTAQAPAPQAPAAATQPTAPTSGELGEIFVRANTAYEAGRYGEAVTLYQELRSRGVEDGRLEYNLGNALLRTNQLGQAIASYRRSLAQRPRDEDARANLSFARKSTKDALAPPQPSPILSTLFFWHYGLSRGELLIAAVLCNVLFWTVLIFRLFGRGSEWLRWSQTVLLVLLLATAGSLVVHYLAPRQVAVILPQEVDALSGTSVDAVVRFKLHAGTEVEVKDQRDGWIRIALPDGDQGWLQSGQAEVVEW